MKFIVQEANNSRNLFNHLIRIVNDSIESLPETMTTSIIFENFNNTVPYNITEDNIKINNDFETLKESFGVEAASFILINRTLEAISSYISYIDDERVQKDIPEFKNSVLNHFFLIKETYQPNALLKKILYDDQWLSLTDKEYKKLLVTLTFGKDSFIFRFNITELSNSNTSFNTVVNRFENFGTSKPSTIEFKTKTVSKGEIINREKLIELFLSLDDFSYEKDDQDNTFSKNDLVASYNETLKNIKSDVEEGQEEIQKQYLNFHNEHIRKENGRYFSLSEAVILISYCYFKNYFSNNTYFSAISDEKLIFAKLNLSGDLNLKSYHKGNLDEDYKKFSKHLDDLLSKHLVVGKVSENNDGSLDCIKYNRDRFKNNEKVAYFVKYVLYDFYSIFYYTELDALQSTFAEIIKHISIHKNYYSSNIHLDAEFLNDDKNHVKYINLLRFNNSLQEWYKKYYDEEVVINPLIERNFSKADYQNSEIKSFLDPSSTSFSSLATFYGSMYEKYPQKLYRKKK